MWQQYTYKGTGGNRPYFVYTPVNYQVGTAVPLLVMLHGCTQTALDFAIVHNLRKSAVLYATLESNHSEAIYLLSSDGGAGFRYSLSSSSRHASHLFACLMNQT